MPVIVMASLLRLNPWQPGAVTWLRKVDSIPKSNHLSETASATVERAWALLWL